MVRFWLGTQMAQPEGARVIADFNAVLATAEGVARAKGRKKRSCESQRTKEQLARFRETHEGSEIRVKVPVGGVVLTADGFFDTTIFGSFDPKFDSTASKALIYEIEGLAEDAREWWPRPAAKADGLIDWMIRKVLSPVARKQRMDDERKPHSLSAFGLTTWVLKAMVDEQKAAEAEGTKSRGRKDPSPTFNADLAQLKEQLLLARARFEEARQRSAQTRYWWGAVLGAVALFAFCAVLGGIFWLTGTPAFYGVAVPAGGIGAMVSLLQRMSNGKLKLDTTGSRDLLVLFGGVRPLIGAIFGIFVFAAIKGGLVTPFKIPVGQSLAFFAVIGFLAGFNERWARDMLSSSGESLQPLAAGGEPVPAPAAGLK